MKQIHSAGKEWLFVEANAFKYKIVGNNLIGKSYHGQVYWDRWATLPPGDWSIFSTLSETLKNWDYKW